MKKALLFVAFAFALVPAAPKLTDELAKPALVVLADEAPLPADRPANTGACTAGNCPRPSDTTPKVGGGQTNTAPVVVGDGR
jgi:hypothetical protein